MFLNFNKQQIMKKTFLIVFAALVAASVNAQLVVDESGKVAVGYDGTSSVASDFAVNSIGQSTATTHVSSNKKYGLYIDENATTSELYGVYSNVPAKYDKTSVGVTGISYATSQLTSGKACGVYGIAGYSKSGNNYGVIGTLYGTGFNGAGVYGSTSPTVNGTYYDTGALLSGRYAGYFKGDVFSTGTITGVLSNTSDYRLKENVRSLSESPLEAFRKMNVVEFNYKQREMGTDEDGNVHLLYEKDSPVLTHKHYGLIAQELQKIYPDLVYEGTDGYYSVAYTEMVPLLIQAVQELSAKLDEAEKSNARRHDGTTEIADVGNSLKTELFQNTPNPFTENTVIPCTIAENVATAMLYIYDLNGKQIDQHFVEGRGKTSVTIAVSSLDAGMYLYSLIADGKVIDTKRMILTK